MNIIKSANIIVIIAIGLSGCRPYHGAELPGPDYYYISEQMDVRQLGRVAFIELENQSRYPDASSDITQALYHELQKTQRFGVTLIPADDTDWKSLQLRPQPSYSLEQLSMIRRKMQTDAILLGTVTEYQPYPHLQIGIRLWLLDLNENQMLWAVENVWNTADKNTRNRIKRYYDEEIGHGYAPLREQMISVSPLKFFRFVANEIAGTLNR